MSECQRKCWDCGNIATHADSVVPHVLCRKCGSQDTRLIRPKETAPDSEVNAAIAATIAELQQKLDAAEERVAELERALDFRVKYTNAQKGAIETFTAENQRLRELLRECIEWVPSLDLECNRYDLYTRIKHAIGRTGGVDDRTHDTKNCETLPSFNCAL